jgi:hypothetical protein
MTGRMSPYPLTPNASAAVSLAAPNKQTKTCGGVGVSETVTVSVTVAMTVTVT